MRENERETRKREIEEREIEKREGVTERERQRER